MKMDQTFKSIAKNVYLLGNVSAVFKNEPYYIHYINLGHSHI